MDDLAQLSTDVTTAAQAISATSDGYSFDLALKTFDAAVKAWRAALVAKGYQVEPVTE